MFLFYLSVSRPFTASRKCETHQLLVVALLEVTLLFREEIMTKENLQLAVGSRIRRPRSSLRVNLTRTHRNVVRVHLDLGLRCSVHGFILTHFAAALHRRAEAVFIQSYIKPDVRRSSAHTVYAL